VKKKKLTAEELSASAWAAALADVPKKVDTVPPGWLTSEQISVQTKTKINSLRRHLAVLIKAGRAEQKTFRLKGPKMVRPTPHYRLK
jgi:hypothetical protein